MDNDKNIGRPGTPIPTSFALDLSHLPNGPTKVVDEDELETMSYSGWNLVAVIAGTKIEKYQEPVYSDDRSTYPLGHREKTQIVPTTRFLMSMDEQDTVAHLAAEKERLVTQLESAACARRTAEENEKNTKRAAEKLEAEFASLKRRKDEIINENAQTIIIKQKLEIDLAKIRQALGDLRIKEILGEAK